jgi:glycosyltransferase involved in cell wall biosynthesis
MISLVVPVYNEADNIPLFLRDVESAVAEPHEVLIVYDFPEDNTLPATAAHDATLPERAAGAQHAGARRAQRASRRASRPARAM